jgi:hypothetical protein
LQHCGLHNTDAVPIANSPKLQYLDVCGNEYISTDFILQLDSLARLKVLHINGAQLSLDNCHDIVNKFPALKYLNGETTIEGEALLRSKLTEFTLLPPFVRGNSPMWGLEGNELK